MKRLRLIAKQNFGWNAPRFDAILPKKFTANFATFFIFGRLLRPAAILISATLLLSGCQNPSVRVQSLNQLPEALFAGYSTQRWYFADVALKPPLTIVKKKKINSLADPFFFPLANKLIVSTYNGYLISLNRFKMNDVDRIKLARGISASPAFLRPLAFIAAEKGKYGLQAYDLLQRKVIWKKKALFSRSSPLLKERMVIHATLSGTIAAFNGITGKEIWKYRNAQSIASNLALHGDTLVACSPNGLLTALNVFDGSELWKTELEHHAYASPMILKGNVYVADYKGTIWAVNLNSGQIAANKPLDAPFYQPCASDGYTVFCMSSDGILRSFTPALNENWRRQLKGVPTCPVQVTRNYLLLLTAQKYFYVLNKHTGKIVQQLKMKRRPASLIVSQDQTVYLAQEYNAILKLQAKSQEAK